MSVHKELSDTVSEPLRSWGRGDEVPAMNSPPGLGARSLEVIAKLACFEAPHINTVGATNPVVWDEAVGANVFDVDGNRYIDLTAGFGAAAIGHRHPRVVAAINNQSHKLLHALGDVHPHPLRAELAERLTEFAPYDEPLVYFALSGSEAVEIATKTAVLCKNRPGLVAFDPSYHGCTLGALSASSRESFRQPFQAMLNSQVRRLRFGCPAADLAQVLEGGDIAGVLLEPIVGREGTIFPPPGWLNEITEVCRRYDVLLIADEILTGFGRTGSWFASIAEGVVPDLICCGKSLAGGLPLAAVFGPREVMRAWEKPGHCIHTTTFIANPVTCAAALATLTVMREERLPDRAAELGRMVEERWSAWLEELAETTLAGRARIREVRGRGLLWAIECADVAFSERWAAQALDRGALLLAAGGILRFSPPLVITCQQLGCAIDILQEAFDAAADE